MAEVTCTICGVVIPRCALPEELAVCVGCQPNLAGSSDAARDLAASMSPYSLLAGRRARESLRRCIVLV